VIVPVQKFNRQVDPALEEAAKNIADLRLWCSTKGTGELRDALSALLPGFVSERGVVFEEIARKEHSENLAAIKSLKKPHWTVPWTFYLVVLSVLLSAGGITIAYFAWKRPVLIPSANSTPVSGSKEPAQKTPAPLQEPRDTSPKGT
jgi:hypothetical protein